MPEVGKRKRCAFMERDCTSDCKAWRDIYFSMYLGEVKVAPYCKRMMSS